MNTFLKTLTLAGVLFGTFATQGNAIPLSDNAPKTRWLIMADKDDAYWQSNGQYYQSARASKCATGHLYPPTKNDVAYNQSWDYWNKAGYKIAPAGPSNLYADVAEYPLPHLQLSTARGGYVYAPNAR